MAQLIFNGWSLESLDGTTPTTELDLMGQLTWWICIYAQQGYADIGSKLEFQHRTNLNFATYKTPRWVVMKPIGNILYDTHNSYCYLNSPASFGWAGFLGQEMTSCWTWTRRPRLEHDLWRSCDVPRTFDVPSKMRRYIKMMTCDDMRWHTMTWQTVEKVNDIL